MEIGERFGGSSLGLADEERSRRREELPLDFAAFLVPPEGGVARLSKEGAKFKVVGREAEEMRGVVGDWKTAFPASAETKSVILK